MLEPQHACLRHQGDKVRGLFLRVNRAGLTIRPPLLFYPINSLLIFEVTKMCLGCSCPALGCRPEQKEPSWRRLLEVFWSGSVAYPCAPSSCRTVARRSRGVGALRVGSHQVAAAQLRADAYARIVESAALGLSYNRICREIFGVVRFSTFATVSGEAGSDPATVNTAPLTPKRTCVKRAHPLPTICTTRTVADAGKGLQ